MFHKFCTRLGSKITSSRGEKSSPTHMYTHKHSAAPAQQAMHCPIHFSLSWQTVLPKAMHADTEASGVVHKGMPTPPL